MEGQESNEEEEAVLNYKSPQGQLIQFVEQKLEKPEIDDSLGKGNMEGQESNEEQEAVLDYRITKGQPIQFVEQKPKKPEIDDSLGKGNMEGQESNEEEEAVLDYRTTKGQPIQFVEQKPKKPEIDDSLGKGNMEGQESNEEEEAVLDYRTTKGQPIQFVEQKPKKPEIDDSLGKGNMEGQESNEEEEAVLDYRTTKGQPIQFVEQKPKKPEIDDSLGKGNMEGQESNEEEEAVLDSRTTKGQLIQFVEQKLKKPEIDNSLGKVLDKFQELTREQTTSLDRGVFHSNFTEDALLIQSCGQLYGKRVDKLEEELLQFHTRMVKYDEKSVKNSGNIEKIKSTKQQIAKPEVRLNRGKRKKIVLAEPESETQTEPGLSGGKFYLVNFDQSEFQSFAPDKGTFPLAKDDDDEEEETPAFEYEAYEDWGTFNSENKKELNQHFKSQLVMEYNKINCRFKPYPSPFFNEMIYDLTKPDVYNAKEGKIISCQLIRQMFEDNDNCLIPDENFVIAGLRIGHVKNKWLLQNKIYPTDYDSYDVAWQQYKREFYAKERRKIQNMPRKSKEDAIRFFGALRKKEQIAREKVQELKEMGVKDLPAISFYTVIVEPLREDYDGIFDPYIPEGFEVPGVPGEQNLDDSLDEIDEIRDGDPQTALVSDPLNQTGYSGFVADLDETDHEEPNKSIAEGTATPFEEDVSRNRDETSSLNYEGATSSIPGTSTPFSENENDITDINESADAYLDPGNSFDDIKLFMSSQGDDNVKIISDAQREKMNNAIKEFAQYNESLYNTLENSYFEKTDDLIAIFYDKPVIQTTTLQKRLPKKKDNVIHDQKEKQNTMKRKKLENSSKDESVPKRSKLLKRQVQKHKRSLIIPVNELKWDSFHSHNYQPEAEEGEIYHKLAQDSGIDISMNITQEKSQIPNFGDKEREKHEMRVRVEEWRQYITPKLKYLEEREFDIHEYCTNIINNIEMNETKPFAKIISGKSSTEVVRYFISSLQLANSLNVEICGAARGQLANDTFQLKLLSKKQYHENLHQILFTAVKK